MLLVRARIGLSTIHGIGCFAAEPIRKGQLVWVLDERLDSVIPFAELCTFPPPAQEFWLMYGYQIERNGERIIVMCGDHAKHMNHAAEPNLGEDAARQNVALRDIAPGEELTCDYYSFDLDTVRKLCS